MEHISGIESAKQSENGGTSVTPGLLFVFSGPSGAGKGTVLEEVLKIQPRTRFSISATTRSPRKGEQEGVHYFFVDDDEFDRMVANDEFLEWAHVHTARYGTTRSFIDRTLLGGEDCLLDIDVQGGLQVMERRPDAIFVYIAPGCFNDLGERLRKRNTEDESSIVGRLETARQELREIPKYTYLVINDRVENAVSEVLAIIRAEHARVERRRGEASRLMEVVDE